jgi:hypothetical protein
VTKFFYTTNPTSQPNPFNWEPRIRLLDRAGKFVQLISQIAAFRLLKSDEADLVLLIEPTIQLRGETEGWESIARGAPQKTQTKWKNWLHARRTILYGNYHIESPKGDLMFHCSNQKALWYLNRGLVDIVGENPPTLRLKFAPGGPGHINDPYYLTPKVNRCVVCGVTQGLNRHHVVPSSYRRHMGYQIKSHSYHDILLMCLDCHEQYEEKANELKGELAKEYDCPLHAFFSRTTGERLIPEDDREIADALRSARALSEFGDRIPSARREVLLGRISTWLGHIPTDAEVRKLAQNQYKSGTGGKDGFMDHGEYVVRRLGTVEEFQKFTEKWRAHFLEAMKPQYLPASWDVAKPIIPEDRELEPGGAGLHHTRGRMRRRRRPPEEPGDIKMAAVKALYMDYCEAVHPDDEDAQDELFEAICEGTVEVRVEEMQSVIAAYQERNRVQEIPTNAPPAVESGQE